MNASRDPEMNKRIPPTPQSTPSRNCGLKKGHGFIDSSGNNELHSCIEASYNHTIFTRRPGITKLAGTCEPTSHQPNIPHSAATP